MTIQDLKNMIHLSALNMTDVKNFYYNLNNDVIDENNYIVFYLMSDSEFVSDTSGFSISKIKVQFNVFSKINDNGDTCSLLSYELFNTIMNLNGVTVIKDVCFPARFKDDCWQSILNFNIFI